MRLTYATGTGTKTRGRHRNATARAVLPCLLVAAIWIGAAPAGAQITIDNGLNPGDLGFFSVDVLGAADSRDATITAQPVNLPQGSLVTTNVVFEYQTWVRVDGQQFPLIATVVAPPSPGGNANEVISSGSFAGSDANDNQIFWKATSVIPPGTVGMASTMTTTFEFSTNFGPFGDILLYRYLDEDISVDDDVFFTRGDAAAGNLQLFTVDNTQVIGVSQSGALSGGSGLANSTFLGWAADVFNNIIADLGAGNVLDISLTGQISNLPPFNHPVVGPANGPGDVTSVMGWTLDPTASTATVVTSLGGVPDFNADLDPPTCVALTQGRGLPNGLGGYATDDLAGDFGIAGVSVANATNLEVSVPNFTPGDPDVSFEVTRIDSFSDAFGPVVVSDLAGNTCTFNVESGVQLPVLVSGWPENIVFDAVTAYIPQQTRGFDVDNIMFPDDVSTLRTIGAPPQCSGGNYFANEIYVDFDAAAVSGGACGVVGYDLTNPTVPTFFEQLTIPGGIVEDISVGSVPYGGPVGYVAAYGAGLVIVGDVCDQNGNNCVIGIISSLGAGNPTWGPAVAVDVVYGLGGLGAVVFVATTDGLQIIDASNPAMPVQIGQIDVNPSGTPLNQRTAVPQDVVVTQAGHAYLSMWVGGLTTIDASTPSNPSVVNTQPLLMPGSAFLKLALSEREDMVLAAEGINGLSMFNIAFDGTLSRLPQQLIGVGDEECPVVGNQTPGCWAFGVHERRDRVGVTYGTLIPGNLSGGYQFIDLFGTPSPACGLIGIEPFLALGPWMWARRRRRGQRA